MARRQAYLCEIQASFILEDEATELDPSYIKYILIENLYITRIIPCIYLSLAVPSELYTKMIENEKEAKFYLDIRRYNAYSDTALSRDCIKGQFTYMMSTSNPNYAKELETSDQSSDVSYRALTLALVSMELLNASKNSFNGIFGNIDTATLMYKAVQGLDAVVKAPKYNAEFETQVIPTLNSRKKLLDYLFNQSPFYDTNFMFFMDFDRTYLIDMTGEGCHVEDGELDSVIFDIDTVVVNESYFEGMEEKNGEDKVANQLITVSEEGEVDYRDLEVNNNIDSDVKQAFKRGGSAALYKNILESNMITIELFKDNLNGTVFTPDKVYSIHNTEDYADYNGTYIMVYKREIVMNRIGTFRSSVQIGLRKVGNITAIGTAMAKAASKRSKAGRSVLNPDYAYIGHTSTRKTKNSATSSTSGGTQKGVRVLSAPAREKASIAFAGPQRILKARSDTDTLSRTVVPMTKPKIDQGE